MVFAVVHLSLRPSVTLVYCVHTAEDIVKLLSRPSSPSSCLTRSTGTQFQDEPLQLGLKNTLGGKNCDIRLKLWFILETVRDRPMAAMER